MEEEITIESQFLPSSFDIGNIDPQLNIIHQRLDSLINNKIIQREHSHIIEIERKGRILFSKYKNKLSKSHEINYLKLIKSSKTAIFTTTFDLLKSELPIIILTDAIGKGNEISDVIKILDENKIEMICGYLIREDTLVHLRENFPRIEFVFMEFAEDEKDYKDKMDLLRVFFYDMVEPIEYRPHVVYEINSDCSYELISELINDVYNFLAEGFENNLSTQISPLKYIHNYSTDFFDEYLINKLVNGSCKKIDIYEKISIRCCYNEKNHKLSVTVYPHLQIKPILFKFQFMCKKNNGIEYCKNIIPKPSNKQTMTNICSECTHCEISLNVLKKFDSKFLSIGRERDIPISKIY